MKEIIKGMANASEAIQENFTELSGTLDTKITELTKNKTFNTVAGGINTGYIEFEEPVDNFRLIVIRISDPADSTSYQTSCIFPTGIGVNFLTYFYKGQYQNVRVTYVEKRLQILSNSSNESRIHSVMGII